MANIKPWYAVGLYIGEVLSQALGQAKTGTAQFILRVKILGKPLDDGSYEPDSQTYERTIYMALTPKTMEYVVPKLRQLGFSGGSVAQLDPSSPTFQDLTGHQINLWCSHKADLKGDIRENWDISTGGQQKVDVTPLDSKQVRQLDALFGKALKTGSVAPVKKATDFDPQPEVPDAVLEQQATAFEADEEDLPF